MYRARCFDRPFFRSFALLHSPLSDFAIKVRLDADSSAASAAPNFVSCVEMESEGEREREREREHAPKGHERAQEEEDSLDGAHSVNYIHRARNLGILVSKVHQTVSKDCKTFPKWRKTGKRRSRNSWPPTYLWPLYIDACIQP